MDPLQYDLCVIGSGTAGFAAAVAARELGRTVVVISAPGDFGGTCIRRGCMPAKTLLASTEVLGRVEAAEDVGVQPGRIHVDVPAIVRRKDEFVDYFVRSRAEEFEPYTVVEGLARFTGPNAIDVDGRIITAGKFVLATGSHIVAPAIPGLERRDAYITSDDALNLTILPASLLVIGAGPVGCEFAQYFARLGVRVTLVQGEDHILRNEDADIAAVVAAALHREGVTVRTGTHVVSVERGVNANAVILRDERSTHTVHVETIMLATGRVPNGASLDLERAGVERSEAGAPVVDAFLRTSNPAIYAAGDILGRRCLVHDAEWSGRIAAQNAFAERPIVADVAARAMHAVYTQPQIAVAGVTEDEARADGRGIRVATHPFEDIGKALVADEPEGFIKMIVDERNGVIGVGIVGAEALDLINEAAVIIAARLTVAEVAALPHLHPTMGEIYVRVAEDLLP
jgi:pyruvate/2-oxoglutarate dehydrogenase complex dihydrolipoamide dehydrogenase (E3) component